MHSAQSHSLCDVLSVEILSAAAQLYEKSHLKGLNYLYDLGVTHGHWNWPLFDMPYTTSY